MYSIKTHSNIISVKIDKGIYKLFETHLWEKITSFECLLAS